MSERLLDAITLVVLFAALTFAGVAPAGLGDRLAVGCVAAGLAATVAAWIVLRIRRTGRLARVATMIRPFLRTSRGLVSTIGVVLLLVTVGLWGLEGAVFWLVAQAVNIDVTFVQGTFVVVLTSFVMSIPSAPGYIGTFDAALLFGLSGYGVDGGRALAFALLWRFVLFVPITALGLLIVFLRYGGFVRRSDPLADAAPVTVPPR